MSDATQPTKRLRESVSIQRAAFDVLDVSKSTIRRLLHAGQFPNAFRVGRSIRIPRADLAAFVRAHVYLHARVSPVRQDYFVMKEDACSRDRC